MGCGLLQLIWIGLGYLVSIKNANILTTSIEARSIEESIANQIVKQSNQMTNSIVQFQFGFSDVRVVLIDNEPWLIAKDVCEVLGFGNYRQACERLDEDEKGVANVDTLGGNQDMIAISESGFYRLVMTSRKQSVKKFQKWVTAEVLPSIRKTGKYEVAPQPQRQLPPVRDILDYHAAIASTPWLASDPILQSLVSQRLAEQLSPGVRTIDAPEQPLNVTSIASNLGYNQTDIGTIADIGKYIAARHQPLGTSQHGKYQVNVYLPSEVSESIDAFFGKQLAIA